jgi:hypothetical protein
MQHFQIPIFHSKRNSTKNSVLEFTVLPLDLYFQFFQEQTAVQAK